MSSEPARFDPGGLAELPDELALGRLPPGRHGLPRSFVVRNQRLRVIAAMLRLLPPRGYSQTTIGDVTREAGVSRSAFYAQFASKEECFLATYDLAGEWLCEHVERAVGAGDEWPLRVRAGVAEALRLLAANPSLAHLVAVDALAAGPLPANASRPASPASPRHCAPAAPPARSSRWSSRRCCSAASSRRSAATSTPAEPSASLRRPPS
jgi:AcrR family transcriptional regulator